MCWQYEVTIKKNPTLGLGITGGVDGENVIKPGDKVGDIGCLFIVTAVCFV